MVPSPTVCEVVSPFQMFPSPTLSEVIIPFQIIIAYGSRSDIAKMVIPAKIFLKRALLKLNSPEVLLPFILRQ